MKKYIIIIVILSFLLGFIQAVVWQPFWGEEVTTEYLEKGDKFLKYSEETDTTKYANRYANIASMYYLRHMIENNLSD